MNCSTEIKASERIRLRPDRLASRGIHRLRFRCSSLVVSAGRMERERAMIVGLARISISLVSAGGGEGTLD